MNVEKKFKKTVDQIKRECCIHCPCAGKCDKIPKEDLTSCETILCSYVEEDKDEIC